MMTNESFHQPPLASRRNSIVTLMLMLILCIYWGAMFYGTHARVPPSIQLENSDKFIHFGAFLGLGALLLSLRASRGPFSSWDVVKRWLVLAVYGFFDELTQLLVGRDAEVFDWICDGLGAAVGLCLVTFVGWFFLGLRQPAREKAS